MSERNASDLIAAKDVLSWKKIMGKGSGGCDSRPSLLATASNLSPAAQALAAKLDDIRTRFFGEERMVELEKELEKDPNILVLPHSVQDKLAAAYTLCPEELQAEIAAQLQAAHNVWLANLINGNRYMVDEAQSVELFELGRAQLLQALSSYNTNEDGSFSIYTRDLIQSALDKAIAQRPFDREQAREVDSYLRTLENRYKRKPVPEETDGNKVYLRAVGRNPVLLYPEQDKLIALGRNTDLPQELRQRAKDLVILTNQKWVIQKAYSKEFRGRGVTPEELIQAGNRGLLEAFDQYDLSRANSFITFAKHKVRMQQQRLTENDSAGIHGARLPVDYYNFVHVTINHIHRGLSAELGRAPSVDEVHERLAQQIAQKNKDTKKKAKKDGIDPKKDSRVPSRAETEEAMHWLTSRSPQSLQARINSEDGDTEFGALLPWTGSVASEVDNIERANMLQRAFNSLSRDEQRVFGSYMGYGDFEDLKTVRSVAEHYGLKESAAKRILDAAKGKMQAAVDNAGYTSNSTASLATSGS